MKHALIATIATLACLSAHGAEQVRNVTPFKTIEARGPVSVVVEVGKTLGLRVEGEQRFLDRVTTEVVNGELRLGYKDKERNNVNLKDGDRVIVTMPELTAFRGEGAGLVKLNNVRGKEFDVNYRGAGSLQMNGQVTRLQLNVEGVGEVVARDLVADDANVTFRGIGEVSVHAKNKLNASVQGMGSLTYHGNPRAVSKSVSGIGSVVAAK